MDKTERAMLLLRIQRAKRLSEIVESIALYELFKLEHPFVLKHWNDFTDLEVLEMCRFQKRDLRMLRQQLGILNEVRTAKGSVIDGVDALFITLHRLAYPSRLCDLQRTFGMRTSTLSECINAVLRTIYDNWHHLLNFHRSRFGVQKLAAYSNALQAAGCPLPRCIGFIDGTLRSMCRPGEHQGLFYSGHKHMHGIKFQSVVTPDGIISHLAGPFEGCRHDVAMLMESGLLELMEEGLRDPQDAYCVYGDGGYPMSVNLVSPFKGDVITDDEAAFNVEMGRFRVSVEWMFAKVVQQFAFVDFKKNLKFFLQPIALYYAVACILTNCHTALYGSAQASDLSMMQPPSLDEYLDANP